MTNGLKVLLFVLFVLCGIRESPGQATPATTQPAAGAAGNPSTPQPTGTAAATGSTGTPGASAAENNQTPFDRVWNAGAWFVQKIPTPAWCVIGVGLLLLLVRFLVARGWITNAQGQLLLELAQVKTKLVEEVEKKEAIQKEVVQERKRADYLQSRLTGPRYSPTPIQEDRYCRILLLGIGGTGKTELIKTMMSFPGDDAYGPNPRMSTGDTKLYSMVNAMVYGDTTKIVHIDIDDYRGQNQGQFLADLQERGAESQARPVDAIVLIVDLFPPPKDNGDIQRPRDAFSKKRVQHHETEWSLTALQSWLGFAGDEWKYFCLFINKVDLVSPLTQPKLKAIKKAFAPLSARSKTRRDVEYDVIVGSAKEGTGVPKLLARLVFNSQRFSYEPPPSLKP